MNSHTRNTERPFYTKGWRRLWKQVTRGHKIVADGWAGAANPHPHPMPHPTSLPTQTHTIFTMEIFTHVLTNISGYIRPILKNLVVILKPFKFSSDQRKPHLSNSMRSKVVQLWMKYSNFAFTIFALSSNDIILFLIELLLYALS